MARGNGRQNIVRDDADRDRLVEHLGRAAVRCSWQVFAFVIMSNHLHVVLKTPEPNLAKGMQGFLSAYANAWARRAHRQRARLPGPLPHRTDRSRELSLDGHTVCAVDRIGADGERATATRSARESRRVQGLSISQVSEIVCAEYGIELSELSRRGSRHPARAAMAYLARRHTAATNGELIEVLGVSRAESVPNLTRRFDSLLSSDPRVRSQFKRLEDKLTAGPPPE